MASPPISGLRSHVRDGAGRSIPTGPPWRPRGARTQHPIPNCIGPGPRDVHIPEVETGVANGDLTFRFATVADLPAIVALLADDSIGARRELVGVPGEPPAPEYVQAFADMAAIPGNRNLVAERDGVIVATLHIAIVPGLSRAGSRRAIIEAVRVASAARGRGIGGALVRRAVEIARQDGCALVELTSSKQRERAHGFYRRLGFEQSHEGFKLELRPGDRRDADGA